MNASTKFGIVGAIVLFLGFFVGGALWEPTAGIVLCITGVVVLIVGYVVAQDERWAMPTYYAPSNSTNTNTNSTPEYERCINCGGLFERYKMYGPYCNDCRKI
jgi:hypothetical protein